MITTSHSPSSRLKQFAKELRLIFPNSQRLNRGNYVMSQLIQACRANEVTDLIIAHEHRGEPGNTLYHCTNNPICSYFSAWFYASNLLYFSQSCCVKTCKLQCSKQKLLFDVELYLTLHKSFGLTSFIIYHSYICCM